MRGYIKLLLLVFITIFSINERILPQANIQDVINRVNVDSAWSFINKLSGAEPITVNGAPYNLKSRYYLHADKDKSGQWIKNKFESYGLTASVVPITTGSFVSGSGKNIIAVKTGNAYPTKKWVICAHYDSMPSTEPAPGADDNASGVAVVIEAARVFSQINCQNTVVFAAFDEEEQGLLGSTFYEQFATANGDSLLGVINLDMIAFDSNSDNLVDIHTKPIAKSVALANKMASLNTLNNIGLTTFIRNPGSDQIDSYTFWTKGYTTITLLEADGDFNTHYHNNVTTDHVMYLNKAYFGKCAKLSIATLANYVLPVQDGASDISPIPVTYNSLAQNYPNPFNPSTMISFSLQKTSVVTLMVYDQLGRQINTLVNQELPAGLHSYRFEGRNLSNGVYLYKLSTGDFTITRKMILLK
jgi:hypothetical protein